MGLFTETPKTKGCFNYSNLKKINRTPGASIEPFLKYGKKITLAHTLICGDEVQETATFLQLTWYCRLR